MLRKPICAPSRSHLGATLRPTLYACGRAAVIVLAVASIYSIWTPSPVAAEPLTQGSGTRRAGQSTPDPQEEPAATPTATPTKSEGGSGTRRAGQPAPESPAATPTRRAPTPTATASGIIVTVSRAGNLRAGPGAAYAIVGSVEPGNIVTVVAVSIDGNWLLTTDDAWIAAFLVDGAPDNLPVADIIVPAAPTPTVPPTATPTTLPTATPTPGVAGVVLAVQSTSNLRGGPGTGYPIVGRAEPGDQLIGVGRTAAADWVLLDSDAWIAAFLVEGDIRSLPVIQAQVDNAPVVPVAAGDAATQRYIDSVTAYLNVYNVALDGMDRLFTEAVATPARFLEESWLQQMGTMLETILLTNDQLRRIQPPPSMTVVHNRLLTAANYLDHGAVSIANGIVALDGNLIIAGFGDFELAANELDAAARLLP